MTLQDHTAARQPLIHGMMGTATFESSRSSDALETTKRSDRSRATVVVADDERYIVEFLVMLLEEEGYEVVPAHDGQQAWELICRIRPDLIITDVMMPRLNGLDLVRQLRESGDVRDTPVILMSAVTRPDSPWTDGVPFLPKPFDIDQLLELVAGKLQPEEQLAD